MNRNYNITHKHSPQTSNNYSNISIDKLSTIINHSADRVFCGCLNYIEESDIIKVFNTILEKIKPNGFVTFSILNSKHLAQNFIDGIISGEDFLKNITNFKSILSIEDIYTKIDSNMFRVDQVFSNDNIIDITIERINI